MNNLERLLLSVYAKEEVQEIVVAIEQLKERYSVDRTVERGPLTEKDVCLITYGDQVTHKGEKTLVTLKGFLDEFLDCITTVHILPFYPYSSDDGFSVIDYCEVNEALGTWHDVQKLAADKRLMVDAVINHISQHSSWFRQYLANDQTYADYFINEDPSETFSKVVRPRTSPLLHEFESVDGQIRHIWTTFSRDQVDLNYRNPQVFIRVIDVLLHYVSHGASLIRLDAIAFMWKESGTSCIHMPQTHALIKAMREIVCSVKPETILITETNVPHAENISYFGNGQDEAHMVYNFTLPPLLAFSVLKGTARVLQEWASSLQVPGKEACFFNFTASHDGVGLRPLDGILSPEEIRELLQAAEANEGLISYRQVAGGDKAPYEINCNYYSLLKGKEQSDELAFQRFVLTQAVVLAMPGLPAIYFHSLVGSQNYTEGVKQTGQNRTINREKLDRDRLANELRDSGSLRNRIYTQLRHLIEVRSKESAFNPYGGFSFPESDDQTFWIVRSHNDHKITAIFNVSASPAVIRLPTGIYVDCISDTVYNSADLEIRPYGFVWLKEKV